MTPEQLTSLQKLKDGRLPFWAGATETAIQPLCASCGKHPVDARGQLCHVMDSEDLWNCSEKSAYFAARIRGIRWAQGGTNVL